MALSATEGPTTEFQFDGQFVQRWIDEQNASDTVVFAPITSRELPPGAIQNLLTIVGSLEQYPAGSIQIERARDWLDRRGVQFKFTTPGDGGYIDLAVPSGLGNSGDLSSYVEPDAGELFGSPSSPATPNEIGSANEPIFSAPAPAPLNPNPRGAPVGGEALQVWSSLGRPAVISAESVAGTPAETTQVQYTRSSEAGGWIALEPILAQTDTSDLESLRLASPEAFEPELGAAGLELDLKRDDALAGEWARAAVFEIIGGDPSETQPTGRLTPNRKVPLNPADPAVSDNEEPSPTLGAASLGGPAVTLLSASGWFDEMAAWFKSRASIAIDGLLASDEEDSRGAIGGWRDYAGAGALLLAIALERLASNQRDERDATEVAQSEKLRLRRAEFAHRLSLKLKPMETR